MIFLSVQSWCFFLLQGLSSNLQGREVQGVDVDSQLCDPTTISPQVLYGKRYSFWTWKQWIVSLLIHFNEIQEYMNLFHNSPRYEWLWLGKNYWYVDRLWIGEINWYCIGFWCWSLSMLSYSMSINFKW